MAENKNEKRETRLKQLPMLILRGLTAFPGVTMQLELSEPLDVVCAEQAMLSGGMVYLLAQRDPEELSPGRKSDFFRTGTIARIQSMDRKGKNPVIRVDGICRAKTLKVDAEGMQAFVQPVDELHIDLEISARLRSLRKEALDAFGEFVAVIKGFPKEQEAAIRREQDAPALADGIAAAVLVNYLHKQEILDEYDPLKRLDLLCDILDEELALLEEEMAIHKEVRRRLDDNQKDFYLREQMRVIKEELGESDEDDETVEYTDKVRKAGFPKDVEEKLLKEVGKLAKTPYSSAESTVLRNYLDTCLEIPWGKTTEGNLDLEKARAILDRDHYGMEKVKERVMEFLAVRKLKPDVKNQILCLVGAPGVGKTSIASSLAEAMGRKYVRVSLGGVRDEADIRGHRRTYVAAMPGRIVTALSQVGVCNPLILLDEVDKLANDVRGDPASALLEVLDSEQNKAFRDHFVEIPVDLSDCVFIATANTLDTVSRPLIDRMEVIELPIYNRREKLEIAKNHLLPKQMKRHGLTKRQFRVEDEAIYEIADYYTAEGGVRNLERELARLCRKAASQIVSGKKTVKITAANLKEYLGERKILPEHIDDVDPVGVVNGMAWNGVGGDLLRVEACSMPGSGKLELTGSLGDVIKESARLAVSYMRLHAEELGIDPDFYKNKDLHIHFPDGATPKDGPSAGVTVATALYSELTGRPVRRDLSMTGEITLHGKVTAIGGLREKTMAAYKVGVRTILIPEENRKDVEEEIDKTVKENVRLVFVKTLDEVFAEALLPLPEKAEALPTYAAEKKAELPRRGQSRV